jgi:hypothetical protein
MIELTFFRSAGDGFHNLRRFVLFRSRQQAP